MAPLRVLVITTLFPNSRNPRLAPFNRAQFAALAPLAELDVIGTVPWRLGDIGDRGPALGRDEVVDSMRVTHPRYPSIPGVPSLNAALMAVSLFPEVRRRHRAKPYDVVLGSYAYPDGCAAAGLGWVLDLPTVIKCHGSDLNRVPVAHPACRVQIRHALARAAAVVVVTRRLGERARELGADPGRVHLVPNGLDHDRFRPMERDAARRRLALPPGAEIVLYLGHLAAHKGVRDLLDAVPRLRRARPRAIVAFVGEGPLAAAVGEAAAREPGGVLAFGAVPHSEVAGWMAAADLFCLPSWDEGMPNTVREAHACGRPVVATAVGGIPEAVGSRELGTLVAPRDPDALADALASRLAAEPASPATITALANVPTWRESAELLHEVLLRATAPRRRP